MSKQFVIYRPALDTLLYGLDLTWTGSAEECLKFESEEAANEFIYNLRFDAEAVKAQNLTVNDLVVVPLDEIEPVRIVGMRKVSVNITITREENFSAWVSNDDEEAAEEIRKQIEQNQIGASRDNEYESIIVTEGEKDITGDVQV